MPSESLHAFEVFDCKWNLQSGLIMKAIEEKNPVLFVHFFWLGMAKYIGCNGRLLQVSMLC